MLSEISQMPKNRHCAIPLLGVPGGVRVTETEDRKFRGYQGLGEEGGRLVFNGHRVSIWSSEMILEMVSVTAAQPCECAHRHRTGHLKMVESESRSVVPDSLRPHRLYSPWNSPGQDTGVGSLSLLQRIFPTQESNPGLLHFGRILYQLNYQGSPDKWLKSSVLWCICFTTTKKS